MTTIAQLLTQARAGLDRVRPEDVAEAVSAGALLVDIRSEAQRARDGVIPQSLFIARNILEWRCDPESPWRDARVGGHDRHVILICDEGYQSSLAAATLQELGFARATDVIGGFQAWRTAGLEIEP